MAHSRSSKQTLRALFKYSNPDRPRKEFKNYKPTSTIATNYHDPSLSHHIFCSLYHKRNFMNEPEKPSPPTRMHSWRPKLMHAIKSDAA